MRKGVSGRKILLNLKDLVKIDPVYSLTHGYTILLISMYFKCLNFFKYSSMYFLHSMRNDLIYNL